MSEEELNQSIRRIRDLGYRLTPQRTEILSILIKAGVPLSAQEVHQQIIRQQPAVSLDTVYRNLTTLTEVGLVSQVGLQSRDSARFEYQGENHHHHAICLKCRKSLCIGEISFQPEIEKELKAIGFRPVGHIFEIYGICAECDKDG
jgi:Fur family zinc uptake transcriptional regulator